MLNIKPSIRTLHALLAGILFLSILAGIMTHSVGYSLALGESTYHSRISDLDSSDDLGCINTIVHSSITDAPYISASDDYPDHIPHSFALLPEPRAPPLIS